MTYALSLGCLCSPRRGCRTLQQILLRLVGLGDLTLRFANIGR